MATAADKKLLSGVNVLGIAYHNAGLEHERLGRLKEAQVCFSRWAGGGPPGHGGRWVGGGRPRQGTRWGGSGWLRVGTDVLDSGTLELQSALAGWLGASGAVHCRGHGMECAYVR